MARCEDFPCCGHQAGDCPRLDSNGRERWRCVGGCGRELPPSATSSICNRCMRRAANRRYAETGEMWPDSDSDPTSTPPPHARAHPRAFPFSRPPAQSRYFVIHSAHVQTP